MGESEPPTGGAPEAAGGPRRMAEILREHPFAEGLDEETIALVAGCARNVVFGGDERLLREGEPAEHVHLLRHGSVALETRVPGLGRRAFMTLGAGELLGASALVPPYRWVYDARALTVVRTIAFDAACLRAKCDADPAVGYRMMQRFLVPLVERLQRARMLGAQMSDDWHYEDRRRGERDEG